MIALFLALAFVEVSTVRAERPRDMQALLIGTWRVERVYTDPRAGMARDALPDDPVLIGRTLIVRPHELQFLHRGWRQCQQRVWDVSTMAWRKVFSAGLFARNGEAATPAIYQVPLDPGTEVNVVAICGPEKKRQPVLAGQWIAIESHDRIWLPETSQTLLQLTRTTPNMPIVASFSCARAGSDTEKAICGDVELASLDLSVAAAFERTREVWPDRARALRDQRCWLAHRDRCRGDAECLRGQMFGRASQLVERILSFGVMGGGDVEDDVPGCVSSEDGK